MSNNTNPLRDKIEKTLRNITPRLSDEGYSHCADNLLFLMEEVNVKFAEWLRNNASPVTQNNWEWVRHSDMEKVTTQILFTDLSPTTINNNNL